MYRIDRRIHDFIVLTKPTEITLGVVGVYQSVYCTGHTVSYVENCKKCSDLIGRTKRLDLIIRGYTMKLQTKIRDNHTMSLENKPTTYSSMIYLRFSRLKFSLFKVSQKISQSSDFA